MDLLQQARKDLDTISQGEFSVDLTITSQDAITTVNVRGLGSNHHLNIDPDTGLPVNARNTHISISEQVLTDAGFAVRNANGEVDLVGCTVQFENSAGQLRKFVINETFPDETLGLIVCILGDYE